MAPDADAKIAPGWRCPLCDGGPPGRIVLRGEHPLGGRPPLRYTLVVCDACGLQRLDPIPSGEELTALYDPAYSPYSPSLDDSGTAARRLKMAVGRIGGLSGRLGPLAGALDAVVRAAELLGGHVLPLTTRFPLSLRRDAALLDYGAGAGGWVRSMREVGYVNLWAYDIPHAGLEALAGDGISVLAAPAPLPERTFDCIRLEHSLEHVPDPVEVMRSVAQALVPGGSAVIALPNIAARTFAAMKERWPALSVPYHLSHFSERSLRVLASRCGLDLVEAQPIPYWEIGWAARRAVDPGLPATPGRAWRAAYLRRCATEHEGDCIAVRLRRPN